MKVRVLPQTAPGSWPELLTVDETGVVLGCSTRTIRRMLGRGELPFVLIGRLKRIRRCVLTGMLKERRDGAPAPPQLRGNLQHRRGMSPGPGESDER